MLLVLLGSEPRLVSGPCTVLFYFMITVLYFIARLLDDYSIITLHIEIGVS